MHVLTKVFIVFAAVLSLVLAALTMAYSVNADAISSSFDKALREAETAKDLASSAAAEYSSQNTVLTQRVADLQQRLSSSEATNANLVTENQSLLASKTKAENEAAAIKNQIGQSQETVRAMAAINQSQRDEIAALRESEISLRVRSLEFEDRVNDLASQNDVYENTIRALREQLTSAQRAAELAMSGASGAGAEGQSYDSAGPVIRGRVTRVATDPASGNAVIEVDVGSNDRVAENMRLHVGRGTDFVATLVIVQTDLQSSLARVELASADMDVQAGDFVLSRFGR